MFADTSDFTDCKEDETSDILVFAASIAEVFEDISDFIAFIDSVFFTISAFNVVSS